MTADSCQNILLRRTLTRRSGLWAQERRQVPAKRCGLDRAESLALLSTMRVSIIIPCYNTERWVGEAIQSAMAQRREIAEIIVVVLPPLVCELVVMPLAVPLLVLELWVTLTLIVGVETLA